MKRSHLALIAVAFAIVLVLGVRWTRRTPAVEVVRPYRGTAVQAVYATGTVEPTVMMPIAARATARLIQLNVDEGSDVEKDQVLARLEDEDLRQTVKELQARAEFAQSEYERNAELVKQNAVSQVAFDRARADLEAARAALRAAQAEMSYMTLFAPADGRIIRRDGEVGELIPANEPIFWLSCCAPLRVSAEVDEEDIPLVQPGQMVLIRADAFPGRVFHGEVQSITPKGDPIARSFRVRIGFTEETPLLIGMTAETNIIISERDDALLVPSSAVIEKSVWVVEGDKLTRQRVEIGASGPEETEIRGGLSPEQLVVRRQDGERVEGMAVRPVLVAPQE